MNIRLPLSRKVMIILFFGIWMAAIACFFLIHHLFSISVYFILFLPSIIASAFYGLFLGAISLSTTMVLTIVFFIFIPSRLFTGPPLVLLSLRVVVYSVIVVLFAKLNQHVSKLDQQVHDQEATHRALVQSQERYRAIVEDQTELVARFLPDGTITFVNNAYAKYFRQKKTEILGDKFMPLIPKEDREMVERMIRNLKPDNPVVTFTHRVILPNGEVRWQRWSDHALFDEEGNILEYQAVGRDITEIQSIMNELRESESRYRELVELSPDAIIVQCEGNIVMTNTAAAKLLGALVPEELIGLPIKSFVTEDSLTFFRPFGSLSSQQKANSLKEERLLRLDGRIIDVEAASIPFTYHGKPAVQIVAHDITDRLRIEKEMRHYATRLRTLYEIGQSILTAESAEGIAKAGLVHIQRLIPFKAASVIEAHRESQEATVLCTVDSDSKVLSAKEYIDLQSFQKGRLFSQDQPHLVQDISLLENKSPIEELMSKLGAASHITIPIMNVNNVIGFLILGMDQPNMISPEYVSIANEIASSLAVALRQINLFEQTKQDAEIKTRLLQEVNHRVKNNLVSIMGILSLQIQQPLHSDKDFKHSLQDLQNRIWAMTTVHDMLSGSKWAPIPLGQLVREVVHGALNAYPGMEKISVKIDPTETPLLIGPKQATWLSLVLNELTTNSIKHAFKLKNKGTIEIQMSSHGDNQEMVEILFKDNGSGWPELVLTGKRENVGLKLMRLTGEKSLKGEMSFFNSNGAVCKLTFKRGTFA
ncbi:MAG: PAS domain S-box protein [Spirochaetia bacterium]